MPHARQLSKDERRIILNMHEMGTDPAEIAAITGRVRGTVYNVIKNPNKFEASRRSGRPTKLSPQDRRNLLRKGRTGKFTTRQIVSHLNLPITIPYARQILSNDEYLHFARMQKKPRMTTVHHSRRLLWADTHVSWTQNDWDKVVWSDEKKFNLDGPDGLAHYWHDKRLPRRIFSRRHTGGGGITLWGAFSAQGVSDLCVINGRLNATSYVNILENYLIPFAYLNHGTTANDFTFMHDGATCHTANITRQWLQDMDVTVMNWPAVSPDLNPIENLWGILAQKVYQNGKQFNNVSDLKDCVVTTWQGISTGEIAALTSSMRNRCVAVLTAQGKPTKY